MQDKDDNGKGMMTEALRDKALRDKSYRERALKLFPWVCGLCGRDFAGKKLKELTVHHRDLNHDNNPPDGSNWELLCIYCHDNVHSRGLAAEHGGSGGERAQDDTTQQPFAALAALLKDKA
ncbi:MAG: YajD family HNH nuclease [Proteobacteria bacterium]|nr:YajD family HNH nuclease [Pseudomonadota bacterium]MBU1641583.1 YajD family HNH nuclease [Pseudomonadota bacterium]